MTPEIRFNFYSFIEDVMTADFDGDGRLDILASSRNQSGTLRGFRVYLGRGDGSFEEQAIRQTSDVLGEIEPLDLDGDGAIDLVALDRGADSIAVYLGNGDGTFGTEVRYDAGGSSASEFAIADFNGDGRMDVAVAHLSGSSLGVLFGNADGSFQAPVTSATLNFPVAAVAGDFTNDSVADVALLHIAPGQLSVMAGNGDGTFGGPLAHPNNGDISNASLRGFDVDSDGSLDLVSGGLGGQFNVTLGNGDGTFGATQSYFPAESAPIGQLIFADLDNNGHEDIVTGTLNTTTSVGSAVAYSQGGGVYSSNERLFGFTQVRGLASGDFDGDGDVDLVIATQTAGRISVVLNNLVDPYCVADCDDSGDVGFNDLIEMLFAFGETFGQYECDPSGNGVIDFNDLVETLFLFGPCP